MSLSVLGIFRSLDISGTYRTEHTWRVIGTFIINSMIMSWIMTKIVFVWWFPYIGNLFFLFRFASRNMSCDMMSFDILSASRTNLATWHAMFGAYRITWMTWAITYFEIFNSEFTSILSVHIIPFGFYSEVNVTLNIKKFKAADLSPIFSTLSHEKWYNLLNVRGRHTTL